MLKLLVYGSKFTHEFEDAAAFGWTVPTPSLSWATLRDNVNAEVDRLNAVYIRLLEGAGVKLHMGRGRWRTSRDRSRTCRRAGYAR